MNKPVENANIIIFLILKCAKYARRYIKIARNAIIKHAKNVKVGF